MAATEVKGALKSAAETVAGYIKDAATLTVETKTIEAGTGDEPILAASTVIKLDGDNTSVVPASKTDAGKWEIDTVLYDLHMRNVQAAIDYRNQIVGAMLSLLR